MTLNHSFYQIMDIDFLSMAPLELLTSGPLRPLRAVAARYPDIPACGPADGCTRQGGWLWRSESLSPEMGHCDTKDESKSVTQAHDGISGCISREDIMFEVDGTCHAVVLWTEFDLDDYATVIVPVNFL